VWLGWSGIRVAGFRLCYYVYFTSCMLGMFRTLIIHHREPATFLLYHHIGPVFLFRCVLEFRCGWFGVVSVWQASIRHLVVFEDMKCNRDSGLTLKGGQKIYVPNQISCGESLKKFVMTDLQ
jgi:hypothetical protein